MLRCDSFLQNCGLAATVLAAGARLAMAPARHYKTLRDHVKMSRQEWVKTIEIENVNRKGIREKTAAQDSNVRHLQRWTM